MSHSPLRIARVNTAAITKNVSQIRQLTGVEDVLVVVKANAYGHGMVPAACAALAGGATWLGVADIDEAMSLREAGITAPLLAWIHAPDETFVEAVEADITLGLVSPEQLQSVAQAGKTVGKIPAVHLKVDTGLSRNGAHRTQWADTFAIAATLQAEGLLRIEGIFSHLSNTSPEDDLAQLEVFTQALEQAATAGLEPRYIHLAASLAALTLPETRFNMVRTGIAAYGISPDESRLPSEFGLTPALTLQARVVATRQASEGDGVSYGFLHRTGANSTLALVPLGYGDGINRDASSAGPVVINGQRYTVAGRIAMDQFVVDLGSDEVAVGDVVVLFGDPATGAPSVHEWAKAAGSIGYEIVTRLGGTRLHYEFVESA